MGKGGETGGFGGGWLEQSRRCGWAPSGLASSWECRAARSRQARPEEAQEPSWGTAKGVPKGHLDHTPVLARGLRLLHALDNVEWVADEPGERSSGGAHRCDHRKRQAIVLRRQHLAQIAGTLGAGRHASL